MRFECRHLTDGGVLRRQTELDLSEEDRAVVEEVRSKLRPHSREVNRAHLLA